MRELILTSSLKVRVEAENDMLTKTLGMSLPLDLLLFDLNFSLLKKYRTFAQLDKLECSTFSIT